MKKIVMVMMALMMVGLISCATTSGTSKGAQIREDKLTSISYLKRICDVKLIYSEKGDKVYLLDDGEGYFVHKKDYKGSQKICLITKDGELYGRSESYLPHNITVTFNLHDNKCTQIYTCDSDGVYWYYTDEQLDRMTEYIKNELIKLSKKWGLEKYVNNIE